MVTKIWVNISSRNIGSLPEPILTYNQWGTANLFDVWGISILMCRHWKLSGFYQNKVGFWPDFADIKHDYTQEFYQSYSSVNSKCLEDRLVSQCLNVKLPSDECQCTSVTFISGQFLMRCPTFKIPSKSPKTHNHQNHFVFCVFCLL